MRIPKRFKLMGHTIEVIYDARHFIERDAKVAFASYRLNQIQMRPVTEADPRTEEQQGHDFYHELMHFIFYFAGAAYHPAKQEYMHQDEGFVDLTAGLLHQALTTMQYEDDGKDY